MFLRNLQVDASKVQIAGSWESVLQSAVEEVAQALDISHSANVNNLEARLYKLLLYEQGGHFSAHQDTEKEKGMIGTLVVQLPCCEGHTGGTLVVRHKGVQYKHDFSQVSGLVPCDMKPRAWLRTRGANSTR